MQSFKNRHSYPNCNLLDYIRNKAKSQAFFSFFSSFFLTAKYSHFPTLPIQDIGMNFECFLFLVLTKYFSYTIIGVVMFGVDTCTQTDKVADVAQ